MTGGRDDNDDCTDDRKMKANPDYKYWIDYHMIEFKISFDFINKIITKKNYEELKIGTIKLWV